jgi:signal peptidase I
MKDHRRGTIRCLVGLALLTAFWLFLAPIAVGGRTTYTVTDGVSMLPGLQAGDLVLVRESSSYHVGDTVLYRDARSRSPVLHRIIALRSGRYYFKGDNNAFVDPVPVARNALVGKLWFHVPRLGAWAGWLAVPAHSAMFTGGVALALVLARRKHRRREVRRLGVAGAVAPGVWRGSDLAGRALPLGVLALLAGVSIAVGFSRPLHRTVTAPAYGQSGDFSYSSRLVTPSPAYPSGYALTGQPMLLELFRKLNVRFNYAFSSRLPHEIHGTIALVTAVSAPTGWHHTFALGEPAPFDGNTAHVRGAIGLEQTRMMLDRLSLQAGAVGTDYDIELRAIVRISGIVDGVRIHETFSPGVPFTFNHQLMRLKAAATPIVPDSAQAAADSDVSSAVLHPEELGAIPRRVANVVAIARLQPNVATIRIAGLSLAGLALVALPFVLSRRREPRHEYEVIQDRYNRLLIPTLMLNPDGRTPIELPDFHSLAVLAGHYGHLILHEQLGDRHTYGVEEDGRLYVYRIESPARGRPAAVHAIATLDRAHTPPRLATRARAHARWRLLLPPLALALAAAVSASLVASVTAGNTVPDTHAGARTQARSLSELTPPQCAGLTLTNLVVMAGGATTVNGTSADDLILGRARNGGVVYNGRGGSDCIVAGGGTGTKRLNGGPGADVCIGSITRANTFASCATTYN